MSLSKRDYVDRMPGMRGVAERRVVELEAEVQRLQRQLSAAIAGGDDLKAEVERLRGALDTLRNHPMFEGDGSIPKANVRFVIGAG